MTDALGLSIGMTNLVAAREGRQPVIRRSIFTLHHDRAPDVGEFAGSGLPLAGFVERVGDPVPLVAADGSQHRGELVLAEALDVMARAAGGGAPVVIAVPAHWAPGTVDALRGALRNKSALSSDGVPPGLVPDSLTALAALQADPGLPAEGVVVLCDFGGSGTSVTLVDAGADFATIGPTVRYPDFSGEQIDQALLNHVLSGIATANDADPAGTAAVGSLAKLRAECRQAKERLSADTATAIPAELPGFDTEVRMTRPELEQLMAAPLAGLLDVVEDTLQRNNIALSSVNAVATVGGGAAIPLVTQRLSERLRAPVVTTARPQLQSALGAALVAERVVDAAAPTGMAPEVAAADAPTGMAPTSLGPAAWAADATMAQPTADGGDSANVGGLAWSQDDAPGNEPVPYAGGEYETAPGPTAARPSVEFSHEEEMFDAAPAPLPWYKRPPILFGVAAAAVLLAAGGLAVTLTSSEGDSTPVTETSTTYSMGPSPEGPPPEPITTVTEGPDGVRTTTVVVPPPPPPETTTSVPETTTTTSPTTTTTTATATTTTTPSTTTTTTTPPTTTRTTTQPPTTTTQPPTTTNPPTTTQPPATTSAAQAPGGGA